MRRYSVANVIIRLSILLLCLTLVAWGDSWDQIKRAAGDITSVQAEFTQKKHMEILARPLASRGRLYFQAPRSLRWEYLSPVNSVLLMHGGTVTRYVRKGGSVIKDSSAQLQSMQIVLQEITLWMRGNFDANPSFTPELRPGRIIVLTPKEKSMAGIIQRIELKLSNEPGVIRSVTIYESRKSYTVIDFNRVTMNKTLPESLFRGL
ncbi:MAG: outer membrane lipoprotein carrier protein LolA [Spirochaetes bacterium]|nr:outer membrane lipoprotein carrier protein LolA [Spirochaetota bacterium]